MVVIATVHLKARLNNKHNTLKYTYFSLFKRQFMSIVTNLEHQLLIMSARNLLEETTLF